MREFYYSYFTCISFIMSVFMFILLVSYAYAQSDTFMVKIEQGQVIGHRDGEMFSFMNVPYATAPTGEDRFKAPLPPPTWTILDAVDRNVFCPQVNVPIVEDCLVANVFVPDTNATDLPVLVMVHGGAYIRGSGKAKLYSNLVATKKLIVVSFNYRIGVFGFLCLGTKDIPGNAGMKDQVALLRWVKQNIASFGGNPDDVTICGCSAGGGSVDLLSLSPMTTGLFKKVISGSGASLGTLGAVMDPLENAKIYARSLNFTNVDDIDALEHFFKTFPTNMYLDNYDIINQNASNLLFTPCVEADNGGDEEMFLPDSPWNIITNKNYEPYPLLKELTNQEGTVRFDDYGNVDAMLERFYDFLPGDLQFESEEQRRELADTVRSYYFGKEPVKDINSFIDYYSDTLFNYPTLRTLNERRKANNDTIYFLEYSYFRELPYELYGSELKGAYHCNQINAVMDEDTTNDSPSYLKMKQLMTEIYVNFVIKGKPSATGLPDWPPMTGKWSPHMAMKEDPDVLDTLTFHQRAEMWDEIYSKYARHPIPPPLVQGPNNATRTIPSVLFYFIFIYIFMINTYG